MTRLPVFQANILRWTFAILVASPLLSGLCLARACADEPELTSLLGADVGLCVEVRDLRSHLRDLPSAEWFRRLREMPLIKRWQQGPEFAKWQSGQATLAV